MEKKFSSDELPLAELPGRAERGELQLPDFQRGWVWDDEHIRSLLVSIARIDVRPGAEPVFAKRKGEPREVFFARLNNATEELSGPALLDYRRQHWPE